MSNPTIRSGSEPAIISPATIALDVDLGTDKESVIGALAERLAADGRTNDVDALRGAAMAREGQSATGLPGGIAIPHCRDGSIAAASLGFARVDPKVDFGAPDGPADLVFLIAAPEGAGAEHMKLLSSLARALVRPAFVSALRSAQQPNDVVDLVEGVLNPAPAAAGAKPAESKPAPAAATGAAVAATATAAKPETTEPESGLPTEAAKTIVAVTACPTGIAHTYMAADSLVAAGERAGVTVHVETQGSSGGTKLPAATIAEADAVIFATDVGVKERERFAGKPVVASGVKRAINEPDSMIADAMRASLDPSAARVGGSAAEAAQASSSAGDVGWGTRIRQILLTGVSYMIPFVAAGGLLIALGFLLAGYEIADSAENIVMNNSLTLLPDGGLRIYLGAVLFQLGSLAFGFLVPALAGYIAFAIADRPGIAPGFTAGAVALFVGAGFIGGLVGGLIAGFAAMWISRIPVPQWARGLMPVVIIPLFASLIVGALMFMVLGKPLAAVTSGLTNWLNSLSGSSAVILGIILGLMMCFDLGGPVNKAAYAFAVAGLSVSDPATLHIMAAVMAAGMVPPLAMALASTVLRPKLFTEPERENGKAAWLLGISFISEGAIPFAAADPLRVIPSMMLGGATTGAIIMATSAELSAPHGGIFVSFAMGGLGGILKFFIALAVGVVVSAVAVIIAKEFVKAKPRESEQSPALATA